MCQTAAAIAIPLSLCYNPPNPKAEEVHGDLVPLDP